MLESLLKMGLLAVLAALCCRVWTTRPALCHALWLLVLVRSLCPGVPLVPVPSHWSVATRDVESLVHRLWTAEGSAPAPAEDAPSSRLGELLGLLWLAGAAALAGRDLRRSLRFRRCLKDALPADPALRATLRRCARRLSVPLPRLCVLRGVSSPLLFGLRHPVIVWPSRPLPVAHAGAAEGLLIHELAHLGRRDHVWNALELLARWVGWWNPLTHLALGQVQRYKELACDAWVAEHARHARRPFAASLLHLAAASPARHLQLSARGARQPARRLKERLLGLYQEGCQSRLPASAPWLLAPLLLLSLVGAAPRLGGAAGRPLREQDLRLLAGFGVSTYEELLVQTEQQLAREPDDGNHWARLGIAHIGLGHQEAARRAFTRQDELGVAPSFARYNMACSYALEGQADAALEWLQRAVESGVNDPDQIRDDPDLQSLHGDPLFDALLDDLEAAR